jgi:hypothetical protein
MDDLLLFDDDRARLHDRAAALDEACARLRLRLHPWQVKPTRGGLGYLGFRVLPGQVRVKRTSVNRATARLASKLAAARAEPALWAAFLASLRSTFAHWAHADTFRLRAQVLAELGLLAGEIETSLIAPDQEKDSKESSVTKPGSTENRA